MKKMGTEWCQFQSYISIIQLSRFLPFFASCCLAGPLPFYMPAACLSEINLMSSTV